MSDRLAILIGNGRFENDPDLPVLFGPRHDVSSLGQVLGDPDIGNFIVFEHLDRDSKVLVSELERLFSISNADATVLLYYGGFVVSKPGKGLFLSTADTKLSAIDDTALSVAFIKKLLRGCAARHKTVILDCCYGGPAGRVDEADIEEGLRRIRTDVDPDLHLIASAASVQSAEAREVTTDTGLEGRLTRCIVKGLSTGAADRDGDNRTGVRDLNEYLGMRLGADRPLWAGPLEGADPEIVANPNPIEGVDVDSFDATVDDSESRSWRFLLTVGGLVVLTAAMVAGVMMRGEPEPETTRLEEHYSGPGLPASAASVAELDVLRDIIDRTGWIEHTEPLDGRGLRYPSAVTIRLDPGSRNTPGTIDLGLREWALIDFDKGIHAVGIACAAGLNIGEVTVETVDGREYTFDVRTDRAGGEFFGFVAREPIRRLRLTSTSARFIAERLYFYARTEHRVVRPGRP
ncbi:MAG: caspase family protein [Acidobacteria bacterium]|nr:caspase family protein [Acidobacteriota bacterium]